MLFLDTMHVKVSTGMFHYHLLTLIKLKACVCMHVCVLHSVVY